MSGLARPRRGPWPERAAVRATAPLQAGAWRALALLIVSTSACSIAPASEGAGATPASGSDSLPPPGYGTLRQDEISMSLRSQDLEVMVTPLAESVTRVVAPDTYERLSGIAEATRPSAPPASKLFLVSFYTQQPEVRFVPEEVQLLSGGLRLRPLRISPVTPSWGQRRVQQRRTEMAVYAFPADVDLESDLVLAYGLEQTAVWSTAILPRIQAERARARARAGIGPGHASRSYFEIFR